MFIITWGQVKIKVWKVWDKHFEQYIYQLNNYDNSIWKPIKNSRTSKLSTPPIRKNINESWAINDKKCSQYPETHCPFEPLTPKEILEKMKWRNLKKALGIDPITDKMLKKLPRKGIVLLTCIFNILRLRFCPKCFKTVMFHHIALSVYCR